MKRKLINHLFLSLLFLSALSRAVAQTPLTLQDYLQQVKTQGANYQNAITNRKMTDLNRQFIGQHWSGGINLGGNYNASNDNTYSFDTTTQTYNNFNWYEQDSANFSGGLNFNNNWDFGINTNLSYTVYAYRDWYSDPPYPWLPYNYTSDNLRFSVGIPLWRNFLGAEIRAQDKSSLLGSDSNIDSNEYQIQLVLYTAKQAYYNLASVRAEVEYRREGLEDYRRLSQWAEAHLSAQDRLQARSAVKDWELALENAEDRERQARNNFNLTRSKAGSEVPENLQTLEELNASDPRSWPSHSPDRLDLQAVRLGLESAKYSLLTAEEQDKLDVTLTGSIGGSFFTQSNYYPAPPPAGAPWWSQYSVGLNFSVPFELFTNLWGINLETQRMSFEERTLGLATTENADTQQWEDMTLRYQKSDGRIQEAAQLVGDDKEKRDQGEALFQKGRVDTFEMVSFVSQYFSARMTYLSWISQKLTLLDQSQLYQAKAGEWKN